jgi:hypothetical protein
MFDGVDLWPERVAIARAKAPLGGKYRQRILVMD